MICSDGCQVCVHVASQVLNYPKHRGYLQSWGYPGHEAILNAESVTNPKLILNRIQRAILKTEFILNSGTILNIQLILSAPSYREQRADPENANYPEPTVSLEHMEAISNSYTHIKGFHARQ
jgi:hypothetical protein